MHCTALHRYLSFFVRRKERTAARSMAAGFSGDQKARRRRGKEEYGVPEEETDEESEEKTDEESEEETDEESEEETDEESEGETDEGSEEETDQSSDEEVANECPGIKISAINVKSLNISTHRKTVECRTLSKLKAITQWRSDIILMSECKLGKNGKRIIQQELEDLGYNRMIANSTKKKKKKAKRGVVIAIRDGFDMDILQQYKDTAENYLLLQCMIDKTEMLVGVVYGPNENDRKFFSNLKRKVEDINLPTILGGDFNTVVDENLDLVENRASFPNYQNSEILRDWLEYGNFCDPYRAIHPRGKAMSFGFRKPHKNRKSRLDFFVISQDLLDGVKFVKYKYVDKPDCGFDHAEVRLSLG